MRRAIALLTSTAVILLSGAVAASAAPTLPSQDPFYSYSGSLAGVAPGTVLKTRSVSLSGAALTVGATANQVLYRTTGELGQPTVTVATIIQPLLGILPNLVSYQTAYDGLGGQCDPSYTLQGGNSGDSTASAEAALISGYLTAGYTVVVPDYEGIHQEWGAGQESGYGTLDGIRAAERFLGLDPAGTRVAMVGYSGGSIATEFASELQPSYASDVNLVGTAEGGVPVDFAHNLNYINGSPSWSGVIPAVLVGLGRAFNLNISAYASKYGKQVANHVKDECINSFLGKYPGLTIQKLLKPQYKNFLGIPLIATLTNHLAMSRAGTPQGPLFMGVGNSDGTGDGVMIANDVEALAHTYCQRGVSVQFQEYKGQDHTGAAIQFEPAALAFVTERLLGLPVPNDCPSIAPGNSLAPLPVATVSLRLVGPSKRRPGLVFELRAHGGTVTAVRIELRRGRKVLARVSLGRLGRRSRRVTLPVRKAGHYLIAVTQGPALLTALRFHLR
jgi:Secretory lipase